MWPKLHPLTFKAEIHYTMIKADKFRNSSICVLFLRYRSTHRTESTAKIGLPMDKGFREGQGLLPLLEALQFYLDF